MMETDADDDEVVSEVDVFLSKRLAETLYVFHYPHKSSNIPNDDVECLSARIKPKQQKLEMEIAINTHSSNYDRSRGEQMAINVDGLNPTGDTYFKSSYMDKCILTAKKAGSPADRYAVGLLRKDGLHITPVHSIVDLKSGFTYMDKIDALVKKSFAQEEEEEEEEAVAVTVRFEGPNAERERQMRQKSFKYQQQKNATEPWINVNYHPLGSSRSKMEYEMLSCSCMYQDVTSSCVSSEEYMKVLVPEALRQSGFHAAKAEELAVLADKPLSDQIKHLLINAHVLNFSQLLEKLAAKVDPVSVERLVQQFAVLVQGCWVVKSELLYDEDSVSAATGLNAKMLISARDYIVWLFTKSRIVTRNEVLASVYIPNEDLKNILSQIAVQSGRGWEFKYPMDADFLESHPAIEQSQEIKWDLRYKKLVKELSLGLSNSEGDFQKQLHLIAARQKQKRHSRSSLSEDGEESGTDSASGSKESKTKRSSGPKKRSNVSPSKPGAKAKPYHIATLDVSPTFLETTPPDDVKAELCELVGEAIKNQCIMRLGDLKELVSESPLNSLVGRSDFEKLVEEALLRSGAQKIKNKWPQNTTPEPLYAFTKFGNKTDRYRNALLDLFSTTARARTNFFVKKVEDELREILSDADCRQMFEDYCIYKSGFYYLKGTVSTDT
ncbi:DNA-directed RNA polymerase III subunit RPC5-like [Uloborus diversus]|uniref:DNA-directed RNA polymerase III subunit RPC5-like n=1 Tax=Uloborus diversus TaxID=327109 RepID=UPI00240A8E74|nr:DNA-directed RNA polymerase III subunit RPC5-like [Uloborus diversus]